MKVTVKVDEAAALTPSEVKAKQAESERLRMRNRQALDILGALAPMGRPMPSLIGDVWPKSQGGGS